VPPPIIGDAVRLMVPGPEFQERVITEAVANWSAEKIVLDEIKRLNDALALEERSKTGVGFSATVHARSLERKAYAPLFGNVDLIARKIHTRVSFEKIIEIKARRQYLLYEDAESAINSHLEGRSLEELGTRVEEKSFA
jgi:stage III sporulation protein SpoIIIAA